MQKKRNSFPKKERPEDKMNDRFGNEEESLGSYEQWELEEIPDDPEDERRRLEDMMQQLRDQGHLTAEEEEKLFGPGGYLEGAAIPEELPAAAPQPDVPFRKKHPRSREKLFGSMKKAVAVMAVVLGGISVVAFSSEANRQYVADMVTYAVGGDTRVSVKTGKKYLKRDITEIEAKNQIEEVLELSVPNIGYRATDFCYEGYEIFEDSGTAYMFYKFNETEVVLYISKKKDYVEGDKILEGEIIKEVSILLGKATAQIVESKDADSAATYSAFWIYNDAYYQLGGKVKLDDLIKMLEKII